MTSVDGIHYRVDGDRDAPAVLLCHPLGADLDVWAAQAAVLAREFCVLRYDARGHGRSASADTLTLADLAEDARAVLDAHGVASAAVIGAALGATAALQLAVEEPERVRRLVLANAAARAGTPQAWDSRVDLTVTEGMAAVADLVLPKYFTPGFAAAHPQTVTAVRSMVERADARGYAACCRLLRDADLTAAAAAVTVPTLVLSATSDPLTTTEDARALHALVARSEYVEIAGAHLACIEHAGSFTAAVRQFLR